jgi:hypothetical protein
MHPQPHRRIPHTGRQEMDEHSLRVVRAGGHPGRSARVEPSSRASLSAEALLQARSL